MSGVTVLASSYRRAPSTSDARGVCKALRACLLPGFPRLRKNDRRTYGEVIGIIWLQTSCQPVGIFANTRLLWNWPAVAFPLYFSLIVARLVATATSP